MPYMTSRQRTGRQERNDGPIVDTGYGPREVLTRGYPGAGQKVAAGDFAAGAGLGAAASFAVAAGGDGSAACDTRGIVTVTSAGAGQSQATATITLTFKEAFPAAPRVFVNRVVGGAGTEAATTQLQVVSVSTTAVVLQYSALPVSGNTVIFEYIVLEA